jgi:hypothetical protein
MNKIKLTASQSNLIEAMMEKPSIAIVYANPSYANDYRGSVSPVVYGAMTSRTEVEETYCWDSITLPCKSTVPTVDALIKKNALIILGRSTYNHTQLMYIVNPNAEFEFSVQKKVFRWEHLYFADADGVLKMKVVKEGKTMLEVERPFTNQRVDIDSVNRDGAYSGFYSNIQLAHEKAFVFAAKKVCALKKQLEEATNKLSFRKAEYTKFNA